MEPIDGVAAQPISDLISRLMSVPSSLPALPSLQASLGPIPIPIHFTPVTTPLIRGGTTFGYVVTAAGQPSPTVGTAILGSGTLWFSASLLGAVFASDTGLVGVPFANATLHTTGAVAFASTGITLDATATLAITVTPRLTPAAGPAGNAIGRDFRSATLTTFPEATITFAPGPGTGTASLAPTGQTSATIYGQTVTLAPVSAPATRVELPTPFAAVPCTPSPAAFTPTGSVSTEFGVSGSASVVTGGVLFPIVTLGSAVPSALPDPADAWGVAVGLTAGLQVRLGSVPAPVRLAGAVLALTPARLVGFAALQGRARKRYGLWTTPPPLPIVKARATFPDVALPQPEVTLDLPVGSGVGFNMTTTAEAVLAAGAIDAILDRPVAADGSPIALAGPALELRTLSSAGIAVAIGSPLSPDAVTSIALDAPNAIIPVGTPNGLSITGTLEAEVISGKAVIAFPAEVVIPTLPDPYAARYLASPRENPIAGVAALITWSAGDPASSVALTIDIINAPAAGAAAAPAPPAVASVPVGITVPAAVEGDARGLAFALLDISSSQDQWGIAVTGPGISQLSFSGLDLQAPSPDTLVFTVPGISWEPVVDGTVPAWFAAFSPDDGTPTTFLVSATQPTPLIPVDALVSYQRAAGTVATRANFTLPFGITAAMTDGPDRAANPAAGSGPPSYVIPAVTFPEAGVRGVTALSVRASGPDPLGLALPGSATVGTFDKTNPANDSYGALVMGATPVTLAPADFWNQEFGPGGKPGGIPVARIDLSGYGTSMFSEWRDPSIERIGVVRANFTVLQGRTAHELVQFQTWIVPWSIRLQRTVVFDRSDGGEVIRHDSGWLPVDVGKFILLEPTSLMAGPIAQLQNVRNITFPGSADVTVDSISYAPVTFDADVVFDPKVFVAANGKNPAASVPATGIQGWADDTVGAPPTPQQIIDLMRQVGRATGQATGIARIGSTGDTQFTMNLTSFAAAVTTGANKLLQVALFGTPRLPKDGQWSVTTRPSTADAPHAVAPGTPVPLTRAVPPATLPSGSASWGHGWRLLDPEDAQSVDNPATFYGLLQGTGTSKMLFEHPLIADAGQAMGFGTKPGLADVGSLLGVGGLFPALGSILQIPDTSQLPLQADGFRKTYDWDIDEPDRTLLNLGIVHLILSYQANGTKAHATIVLDATPGAPTWSIRITNLSVKAVVDGFSSDALLTVQGGFQAGSTLKPGFVGLPVSPGGLPGPLGVLFGDALSAVKDIFSGLSDLAKDLGGDANLDVGFTGQQLSVQQGFTLPTIPLGFGEISDLGIDLGFTATIPTDAAFHVGIGSKQEPFQWVVDPLSGTGAIVLGVDHGAVDVYVEAGLGLGLAIDVAIASGSASIVVGMSLEVGNGAITLGLMLTGKAEVDVLGGLASASLTLSATLSIALEPAASPSQAELAGQVAVGIHISICWVINIDFDGSWGFSTTVSL
jgi:hypothetical protein